MKFQTTCFKFIKGKVFITGLNKANIHLRRSLFGQITGCILTLPTIVDCTQAAVFAWRQGVVRRDDEV
jgi:hypothetical protein